MNTPTLEELQYPIGKFTAPETMTRDHIENWTEALKTFPLRLERLVADLTEEQLDTPYRPGGWTVRQVVHHLYDSHTNSYVRFKWTLTEDTPMIKAYYEDRWAELPDMAAPIVLSLRALEALHAKWVYLLKGVSGEELQRVFIHPAGQKEVSLAENIGIYAWHCDHHYAHISNLLKRNNWV
ncbi:YfiT family bacillithiol transferase [Sinomicrobium weinanense]|uniref:Metal-dependent hydrolase n=1 Tax=Sinomicrobium weinanense TaxID=2842200 RepID=A0A926Q3X6_9FLAO|nr:putative metal-dependent hydrolase [Sinomicrobium weinanense]MBC9797379.1 putative metal-dependent hydrolase [Sinomicrobium weinanense]MBU3123390.1 putative metal-dependent hydrolase [Sinomicrobium weinanense]